MGPAQAGAVTLGRNMKRLFSPCVVLLLLAGLALLLGGCAKPSAVGSASKVLPGEIFAPGPDGPQAVDVAERAKGVDYLLVGEGHGSACDHRVQADVIAALAAAGLNPVVGLEMVAVDKQPVLDRFNAGEIEPVAMEQALDWKNTWGHDFSGYLPVFEAAKKSGTPLVALNVPKGVVGAVSQGGVENVAEADRVFLPLAVIPPGDEQVASLRREFSRHKEMMGADRAKAELDRFMLVQSLWDTAMAGNAVREHKRLGRPVVILAGAGHVEYGWGIARRIAMMQPGAAILSVEPWRGLDEPDPAEGDLFFYCTLTHTSRLGFVLEQFADHAGVVEVTPGTKAAEAGFQPGDRIETVQGMVAEDLWVLHKAAVQAKRDGQPLVFTVLRAGQSLTLRVPLTGVGSEDAPTPHSDSETK